ncbi:MULTISPECIES: hypothetical protein [Streptomyces]|uniref:hypothetical protein n=1 Tax=Streptomyces TaxID=1883 RepID=UPI0029A851B6|nr:hypothetical protein [Streptomyces stelliscabiei]MDX2520563.1 hypothetical protein [Streptomyces stelliscabiei]MDX2552660.1 hypothetical protein [Streptomyces stelliscabiei]MDX2661344.1 hypothetical protein [Streptomyces stelliscabiei]MDX2788825.1 hypothetical protein [Streptomyces stelliscabiei]
MEIRGFTLDGRTIILDEVHTWTHPGPVVPDVDAEDLALNWPRQHGKSQLRGELQVTFQPTDQMRRAFGRLNAQIEQRRTRRLLRLARDLSLPLFLVRSRFNAVERVLEASGIGDGYGGLTIPQPVRPPVQLPDTWPAWQPPYGPVPRRPR